MDYTKVQFTSLYRYERVSSKGHQNFSIGTVYPASFPLVTIPHGLGYVPYYMLYIQFGAGSYWPVFTGPLAYDFDSTGCSIVSHYADTSNIYVQLAGDTNGGIVTGNIYYRIYAEQQI